MKQMSSVLEEKLGQGKVRHDADLFPFLSLRTHTKALHFFVATSPRDLIAARKTANELGIPFRMLGGGTNIAAMRETLDGLTVKNEHMGIRIAPVDKNEALVTVASGTPMSVLVSKTIDAGLSGFEYHKGLPGTVGGALCMNSKWTRPLTYTGDRLVEAVIMDKTGATRTVDRDYMEFAYDHSKLQETGEVVIDAVFRLPPSLPETLRQRAEEAFEYRKRTQPMGVATCGCFFRNIDEKDQQRLGLATKSAGFLIDSCGFKNARVGSFHVSGMHANFIIGDGKGSSNPHDLLQLITDIKKKVYERYGVILHEEVVLI